MLRLSDIELQKHVTCALIDNKVIKVVVVVDGQPIVATSEFSSVIIDGEVEPVTFEDLGNDDKVNCEEVIPASEEGVTKISDTIVVDKNGSVATKKRKYYRKTNRRTRF